MRWSRNTWTRWLDPEWHPLLTQLPDRIGRAEATRHAAQINDEPTATRAFIVAMIWGYGPVGYGAYRTHRILTTNSKPGKWLLAAAHAAQENGPMDAFTTSAHSPLHNLGVAFGTKYLYFCTKAVADAHDGRTAPVLDNVVRQWFATHANVELTISSWRPKIYRQYLTILEGWASELALPMDTIEELIFRAQISDNGSILWSEAWASTPPVARDALSAVEQLRMALGDLGVPTGLAEAHLASLQSLIEQHTIPVPPSPAVPGSDPV